MGQIVIPMAGAGARFVEKGYDVPKPFIEVVGEPMFVWAIRSLPLDLVDRIIFVCLQEHLATWPLQEEIQRRYEQLDTVILPVSGVTEGQLCTVLLAREYIDNDDSLIVHNVDTYYRSTLAHTLANLDSGVAGVIPVFEANDPRWSFARIDDAGNVIELAEKRPISRWASTGTYHFSVGRDFLAAADELIRRGLRVRGEYYVAPVYNLMIAAGARFRIEVVQRIYSMGTPEELERTLAELRHESVT